MREDLLLLVELFKLKIHEEIDDQSVLLYRFNMPADLAPIFLVEDEAGNMSYIMQRHNKKFLATNRLQGVPMIPRQDWIILNRWHYTIEM